MGTSLTIPPPKHAGGAMFYPITSRAVRRRKGELGAFAGIDIAAGLGRPRRISPRDKRIPEE
jgi:hypothetical protein